MRKISTANPLWGAPRIGGELLKLGIDTGLTSVAEYVFRRRRRDRTAIAPSIFRAIDRRDSVFAMPPSRQ